MNATTRTEAPIAIEGDGVEIRLRELGGGMSTAFVKVPQGADLRPALVGLHDDLCQCPRWGYLLKGRVRMHTRNGAEVYDAGQSFYWAPGHAPEALEDSEYVDFSPTDEFITSSTTSRVRNDLVRGQRPAAFAHGTNVDRWIAGAGWRIRARRVSPGR